MFREWNFLLAEIWGLLALAALVGLAAGWLIWGRIKATVPAAAPAPAQNGAEIARLKASLETCTAERNRAARRIAALEADLAAAQATPPADPPPAPAPVATLVPPPEPAPLAEMSRPAPLSAPRGDAPDDLKLIKGIGPKMEALCHRLGFYHFDQIAAWTPAELAWVDANLEDFKGRASRDDWIGQARILAAPRS